MPPTEPKDQDGTGDALAELARAAEEDLLREREARAPDEGELIESPLDVTFVLVVPGYRRGDIAVYAEQERLKVESYDFKIVKCMGSPIDPTTARSTYVNGVLSVRVDKRI
ncbi:MAG: Hsp20/alpha crystallin family protein [Nitrososphaerota archaeon]|nr:Hsp20/alpha crystallin family protein [Nitrososphaerota archaeon]